MNDQMEFMAGRVTAGKMTRREFMGKAAALGVSAAMASTLFADAARASSPKQGGDLKIGSTGGESTNSLDPATYASQVPYHNGRQFGDTLVEVAPDGTIEPRLGILFFGLVVVFTMLSAMSFDPRLIWENPHNEEMPDGVANH